MKKLTANKPINANFGDSLTSLELMSTILVD